MKQKKHRFLALALAVLMLLSIAIPVMADDPPSIDSVYIDGPSQMNFGDEAEFSAIVSGGLEPFTYNYNWEISGPARFSSASGGRDVNQVTIYATGAGEITVSCEVNDGSSSRSASTSVTAIETAPARKDVNIRIDPSSLTLDVDESTTIAAYVLGGEPDSFSWESSDLSVVRVEGSGQTVQVTGVGSGSARITLTATDGYTEGSDSITVTVNAKSEPVQITGTGSSSRRLTAGDTLDLQVSATGGNQPLQWSWDASGQVAIQENMRGDATIYGRNPGSGTVTVRAADPYDSSNYDTFTWDFTVESGQTELKASMSPASTTIGLNGAETLRVTASGGSGNPSNYVYNWWQDAYNVSLNGSGATAGITASYSGRTTVYCDVQDKLTGQVVTVSCVVTVQGGSGSADLSGYTSVGANMNMNDICNQLANAYRNQFGTTLNYSASIHLSSVSSRVGTLYYQDGIRLNANDSISYASLQDTYFDATYTGQFSTYYILTDGGNRMDGTINISVSGGAGIDAVTISRTSLNMATYSTQSVNVTITPSTAYYDVAWSSSNNNVVAVYGSDKTVTLSTGGTAGRATVTARVTDINGKVITRSCDVTVTSSATYNPTLDVTLGSDYYGTKTSDSMAAQFRAVYGYNLVARDATITFSSLGSSRVGTMYLGNTAISARRSYTFNDWIEMHFEPVAAGTYTMNYTLSYLGDTLSGEFDIYVKAPSVNATINPVNLELATFSNQYIDVTVTPRNAYYRVSWASSNSNVVTVTGNSARATVQSKGVTGTATVTATITDRNGIEIYRSCTVKVVNKSTYDPSVATTIGIEYTGTGTSDAMRSQFKALYNVDLNDNAATIRFSGVGNNSIGVMREANGTPIQTNRNYTFADYRAMKTEPVSAGVFSVPYTLTYNNHTLSGTVSVNISAASVVSSITIPNAPYSFSEPLSMGTGASLLSSAVNNGIGSTWSYATFSGTTSEYGTLYQNSSRTAMMESTRIPYATLNNLYFVPAKEGTFACTFKAYNDKGGLVANGTLAIVIGNAAPEAQGPTPEPVKVCHTLQKFIVNGVSVPNFEVYSVNDENYFKLRDLAMLLNGTTSQFAVGYNETTTAITLSTGSAYNPVGGELAGVANVTDIWNVPPVAISTSPVTIDGRTVAMYAYRFQVSEWAWNNFYRLKDLGDLLGFHYSYDLETNTVTITSK